MTVADINRDGFDDIFLGNIWGQQQLTPRLLLGKSNGKFTEAPLPNSVGVNALVSPGTVPVASLFCDVTGDGIIDLIAGGGETGVFLYKGLSVASGSQTGPFFSERTALPVGQFGTNTCAIDIQSLDINHDGRQDLLLSQTDGSYQGRAIQLLIQTEQGQWQDESSQRLHDWDRSAQWITFVNLVDINQDGHMDLLASGTSDQSDCTFINDGTGHFYPAGASNGVPMLSEGWLMPAGPGQLLSVQNSYQGLLSVSSIGLPAGLTGPDWSLPALSGAPGFNEQYYLRQNPEVAASVAAGRIASGLADYLSSGMSAGLRAYAPGTKVWGHDGMDTVHYVGNATSYKLQYRADGTWNLTGAEGTDSLVSVERVQFADKTVIIESQSHDSYADLPEGLYQFFITAFNAAPGVTYMDQLAEAYRYGLSVKQIVDIFTTKTQFTSVYPSTLNTRDLATALINNIVKDSATPANKAQAIEDIQAAMAIGWTVGDVIYQVFGNLARKPLTDAAWGQTALQFNNEVAVAKFYTETLNQSTTDMETLRSVMAQVSHLTDVSTPEVQISLIGQALLAG